MALKNQLPLFKDPTELPTGKYHVSYSEISDWMDCSFRHKLKHIDKISLDRPSIHTEYGRAIHDTLEHFVLTKEPMDSKVVQDTIANFQNMCEVLKEEKQIEISDGDIKSFSGSVASMLDQVPVFLDTEFPGWEGFAAEHYLFEKIDGQTNKWFKGFIDSVIKIPKGKRRAISKLSSVAKKDQPMMRLSELVKDVTPKAPVVESSFSENSEYWIFDWKTTSWGWPAERKRDFQKQLQLVLYKHFFCRLLGLRLDQVKCGFVLLKRTPKKSDGSVVELVPVSVGPKTEQKAVDVLHDMINQIQTRRTIKNRASCRFCEFANTVHCP